MYSKSILKHHIQNCKNIRTIQNLPTASDHFSEGTGLLVPAGPSIYSVPLTKAITSLEEVNTVIHCRLAAQ